MATINDIKNLITSKIAGQGSAVDAGSALPDILNGVVSFIETQQEAIIKMNFDITTLDWQGGSSKYAEVPVEKETSIFSADHLINDTGFSNPRIDGLLSVGLNNQDQDTLGSFILKVAPQLHLETIWGVWGSYAFYPSGPNLNYAEGYALVHSDEDDIYLVSFLYEE